MKPVRRSHPWLLLAPTLAVLSLFFFYPLLLAGYRSFFAWDLLTPPRWVGAAHYQALSQHGELVATLGRSLSYSVVVVLCSLALGLLLATQLNREGRIYAFVRGAIFSAYIVSWVSVALLWMWLLDAEMGLLSRAVEAVGLGKYDWLGDPKLALYALAGVSVWKITGYSMVIFLAGLQDIPKSVLEAAQLDGASSWQRFRYVVWPLLAPTTTFVATTSLILSFQAFDVVRVMTQGGPVRSTTVFVYAIYEHVFVNLRVGRASALTVAFFVVLMLLTLLQLWTFRRASRGRVAT